MDASRWQAIEFEWRSPSWQHMHFPQSRGHWPSRCIRAFPKSTGGFKPLLEVAAAAAFWRLSNDFWKKVSAGLPASRESGAASSSAPIASDESDMFGLCLEVVKKTLKCSDKHAIGVMRNRLNSLDGQETECWTELLNVNGCLRMLDRDEEQEIRKDKSTIEAKASVFARFVRDWRCANEAVSEQPPEKAPRRKPGGKGARVSPHPPFPSVGIDQGKASSMCPPDGSIWRGLSNGSWQCHLKGFKRRSFMWADHGFDEACRQCLEHMWHLHLASQGRTIAQCPVAALFSADEVAEATGASRPSRGGAASSSRQGA